jgi:hypothetical protein
MLWDHVAYIDSDSDPGREWELKRHVSTGTIGCSCPSYRFKKGDKTCRHIDAWRASQRMNREDTVRLARAPVVTPTRTQPPSTTTAVRVNGVTFNIRAPRAVSFATDDL